MEEIKKNSLDYLIKKYNNNKIEHYFINNPELLVEITNFQKKSNNILVFNNISSKSIEEAKERFLNLAYNREKKVKQFTNSSSLYNNLDLNLKEFNDVNDINKDLKVLKENYPNNFDLNSNFCENACKEKFFAFINKMQMLQNNINQNDSNRNNENTINNNSNSTTPKNIFNYILTQYYQAGYNQAKIDKTN